RGGGPRPGAVTLRVEGGCEGGVRRDPAGVRSRAARGISRKRRAVQDPDRGGGLAAPLAAERLVPRQRSARRLEAGGGVDGDGRSYRSASDTGIPFRIVTAVAQDGSLRGTMTYTSLTAPPVPVRAREVSDTVVVSELGPYHSLSANADVVTTTTGKVRGDSLNGTFEMRPAGGGNPIMSGNFRSKRVTPLRRCA